MNRVTPYAKAVLAGAVAFTGAVATGYSDGTMTAAEWWTSASAGLVALGAVFGVPNRTPLGHRRSGPQGRPHGIVGE